MNESDSMSLREIEWVGAKQAVIRLDMWRGDAERLTGLKRLPVLYLPLARGFLPIREPGEYEVRVEWNLWYDAQREVYTRYSLDNIVAAEIPEKVKAEFKSLVAKQTGLTFTLQPVEKVR